MTAGRRTPSFADVRWTTCSLADYETLYWERIAPCLTAEGVDPATERPSHEWFREHGARSFLAALRRHHGRSFGEFWRENLGLGDDSDEYDWATSDGRTREALERFLDRRASRHGLAASSVATARTRLNLYVRAYREANGTDDLLTPVERDAETPAYAAVDACYAAFDWLNDERYSAGTLRRVRRVVDAWYGHLVGRRLASTNPASGLYEEFRWERTPSPTPALSAAHVRRLMRAATSPAERVLVTALAGWGLRAGEVAALHVSQVVRDVPDDDVPYVRFERRKNGPGEVSVLFGLDALDAHLDELVAADGDGTWDGSVFPSPQGETPHITRETVRNRFQRLARAADLPARIGGERPSPQLCRRFWYDTYTAVLEGVLDGVEEIAAEQGSSDPRVVMRNYLSTSRARRLRREFMRERLAEAFGV